MCQKCYKTSLFLPLFLTLLAGTQWQAFAQRVPLIGVTNTTWSYLSNKVDPVFIDDEWTRAGFDDSAWGRGRGMFGFEPTIANYAPWTINTPIDPPSIPSAGAGPLSSYFRTHFNWTGSTAGWTFLFTNYVDDGILVFLNGVELFSFNIPETPRPLPWDTLTLPLGANPLGEGTPIITNVVPGSLLVPGSNVLAVALHQQANTTSDDVFGMSLTAIPPLAPTNTAPAQPTNRTVLQFHTSVLTVSVLASPAPTYQWFVNNAPIPDATNATLVVTNENPGTSSSNFFVRVTNPIGSLDSRTAVVLFTADTNPPVLVRASGSATFDQVVLEFGEVLEPIGAGEVNNYTVSAGGGPLSIESATPSDGGRVVTLLLNAVNTLAEGQQYTVTVGDVTDLALNPIRAPNNSATFRSWVRTGCGGLVFEAYNGTSGPTTAGQITSTAVSVLTNHPSFPNSPSERLVMTNFTTRDVYADDSHENFGGRVRGLFLPPVSGNWKFYLRGDDGAEIWLNPNGPSASGRALIARQAGYIAGAFAEEAPGARTSAPIPLTGGQAYYIEALYKEAGGGDYVEVAAKLESDPTPPASLTPIPGAQLGSPAAPTNIVGAVVITQQPANNTTEENRPVTFAIGASNANDAPICYQWRRDLVDIPGAIGPSYTFQPTRADSGARFSVLVGVLGSELVSGEATLTVGLDTARPLCVGAFGSSTATNVTVSFSELMATATAEDIVNYQLPGFTVQSARLDGTGTNVLLTLDQPLAVGSNYTLRISGVTDQATTPNIINPNPCLVTLRGPVIVHGVARFDLFFSIGNTVVLTDLTGAAKYPHSPDLVRFKDILEANTADEFDNYGIRLSGFLKPPVSGDYVFYMHSDDNGELWLSTNADPRNVVLVAREPVWSNRRVWTGESGGGGRLASTPPANISNPITLTSGQLYFFEALMKEGGGGDNLGVTWQLPGGPVPVNATASIITAQHLAALADPVKDAGAIGGGATLSVIRVGNQITLSWSVAGFRLQRKSSLNAPGGWIDVPGGATSPVTVTIGAGNEFFRLTQ